MVGYLPLFQAHFFEIYKKAKEIQLEQLIEACHDFMEWNANAIVKTKSFTNQSARTLVQTLSRDTFSADEFEIFRAVRKWCARNKSHKEYLKVLETLRLPLMDVSDLVSTVRVREGGFEQN